MHHLEEGDVSIPDGGTGSLSRGPSLPWRRRFPGAVSAQGPRRGGAQSRQAPHSHTAQPPAEPPSLREGAEAWPGRGCHTDTDTDTDMDTNTDMDMNTDMDTDTD